MPGSFAVTMATGIVSAALRLAGPAAGSPVAGIPVAGNPAPARLLLAEVLLGIAAASFAVLLAASLARFVLFREDSRADLADPARAFSAFAFVAACDVLASDLAPTGQRGLAAALAIVALLAWIGLTALVPGRLIARARPFPVLAAGGSWYLWAVATQSLVIALTSVARVSQAARVAAVAGWLAGLVLYAAVSGLILARLRRAGLARTEPTAPYWVAMGAASISVLAAAELLGRPALAGRAGLPGPAWMPAGAARTAMTWVAVGLWALASVLIVPLAARGARRHLAWREPLRYRLDLWMVIFPAGMYATASARLGASVHIPVLASVGRVAVWPAVAGWALVFAAMAALPAGRCLARVRAPALPEPPIVEDMDEPARDDPVPDYEEDRPGDPPCLQRRVCPACGSVADEDPPTTCPSCGADLPAD